jgi:hypothetical protein
MCGPESHYFSKEVPANARIHCKGIIIKSRSCLYLARQDKRRGRLSSFVFLYTARRPLHSFGHVQKLPRGKVKERRKSIYPLLSLQ